MTQALFNGRSAGTMVTAALLGGFAVSASAQTLFSADGSAGNSSLFTIDANIQNIGDDDQSNSAVTYGFDYGNYDIFGDGFNTGSIPVAPRTTDASTSGIYMTANFDTLNGNAGNETNVAIFASGLNVGTGTANPNYVFRFDAFHSTATGIDDGAGNVSLSGSTNYQLAGINYSQPQLQTNEVGIGHGQNVGQGAALAITADTGASDDWVPIIDGAFIDDRNGGTAAGQFISDLRVTGLTNQWIASRNGNDMGVFASNESISNQLAIDAFPYANALNGYYTTNDGSIIVDYDNANNGIDEGVPSNRWATHEVYYVDGVMTYAIDGVVFMQRDFDAEQLVDIGTPDAAGSVMMGFWDRFGGSISTSPEGANFVIYDNIEVEVAGPGDVPSLTDIVAAGYAPLNPVNGNVNFDFVLDGNGDPVLDGEGNPIPILDAADQALVVEGRITNSNLLAYDANFDLILDASEVAAYNALFFGTGLSADFNGDGTVDLLDLDILGANWQMTGTASTGDANGDGTVDLLDLDLLGAQWQMSASFAEALAASGVPEPGSLALLALGGLAIARRRRSA